uniref:Transposase n=1 Tax=Haemonchus contortus TaxID=6289 RepID=A0A7I4YCN1_HAECO
MNMLSASLNAFWEERCLKFTYTHKCRRESGVLSSAITKIRGAADYVRKSNIRWTEHVMRYNDDRWTKAVTGWIPRKTSSEDQDGHQRYGQSSSRELRRKEMVILVSLKRGRHWITLDRNRDD